MVRLVAGCPQKTPRAGCWAGRARTKCCWPAGRGSMACQRCMPRRQWRPPPLPWWWGRQPAARQLAWMAGWPPGCGRDPALLGSAPGGGGVEPASKQRAVPPHRRSAHSSQLRSTATTARLAGPRTHKTHRPGSDAAEPRSRWPGPQSTTRSRPLLQQGRWQPSRVIAGLPHRCWQPPWLPHSCRPLTRPWQECGGRRRRRQQARAQAPPARRAGEAAAWGACTCRCRGAGSSRGACACAAAP
jgi:hypothetical protein